MLMGFAAVHFALMLELDSPRSSHVSVNAVSALSFFELAVAY